MIPPAAAPLRLLRKFPAKRLFELAFSAEANACLANSDRREGVSAGGADLGEPAIHAGRDAGSPRDVTAKSPRVRFAPVRDGDKAMKPVAAGTRQPAVMGFDTGPDTSASRRHPAARGIERPVTGYIGGQRRSCGESGGKKQERGNDSRCFAKGLQIQSPRSRVSTAFKG